MKRIANRNGVLEAAKNNDAAMDIDSLTLEELLGSNPRDDEEKSSEFQLMITSALQRIRRIEQDYTTDTMEAMYRLTAIATSSKNWHYSQGNQMRIVIWINTNGEICRSVVAAQDSTSGAGVFSVNLNYPRSARTRASASRSAYYGKLDN